MIEGNKENAFSFDGVMVDELSKEKQAKILGGLAVREASRLDHLELSQAAAQDIHPITPPILA